MIYALILAILFSLLAIIHLSWAVGSTYGFENTLPTRTNGERVLQPKRIDCVIVGLCLTAFALFYLMRVGIIDFAFPSWVTISFGWVIPAIFLVRALGDFNYVGFFKKIKNTEFGILDTKFYSPLCLLIAVLGLIVQLK